MKITNNIRRIDDLGRVVIPTGIRQKLGIHDGAPLEISYNPREKSVTFKLYETDAERRAKWLNEWITKYRGSGATSKRVGNMTIVACGSDIGTTRCARQDTFNYDTGRAVAYAKLRGERIPDYI